MKTADKSVVSAGNVIETILRYMVNGKFNETNPLLYSYIASLKLSEREPAPVTAEPLSDEDKKDDGIFEPDFILAQKDLDGVQMANGKYWHYSQVVQLLRRFRSSLSSLKKD